MSVGDLMNKTDIAVATLTVVCFVLLAGFRIYLPGPWDEETLAAKFAMQMLLTNRVDGYSITILGKQFLMAEWAAEGALQAYSLVPFFGLLGVNVMSMRFSGIFYSAIGLVFFYFLARRTFSRKTAIAATSVLASMPSFFLVTRLGDWAPSILFPIAAMLLWATAEFYLTKKRAWLLCSAFLAGLGLNSKLVFLWLVIAIFCCGILKPSGRRTLRGLGFREVCLATLFFLLGSIPFLIFVALNFGQISTLYTGAATQALSAYPQHAIVRLGHIYALLAGTYFSPPGLFGEWHPNPTAAIIVILCVLFLCVLTWSGFVKHTRNAREATLLLLLTIVFVPTLVSPTHYVPINLWILLPILALAVGATFERFISYRGRWRLVGVMLVTVLVLSNCIVGTQYYASMTNSNGLASRGTVIYYCIAEYLDEYNISHPIAMDWGFNNVIPVLTQNRVQPIDKIPWIGTSDNAWVVRTEEYVKSGGNRYLFWIMEGARTFDPFKEFERIAQETGHGVRLETRFVATDGTVMAGIYRVEDLGSSEIVHTVQCPAVQTFILQSHFSAYGLLDEALHTKFPQTNLNPLSIPPPLPRRSGQSAVSGEGTDTREGTSMEGGICSGIS